MTKVQPGLAEAARAETAAAKASRVKVNYEQAAPFDIPATWQWVYLRQAMNLVNGKAFKPRDWTPDGLPIVRIQNLNRHDAPFNRCNYSVPEKYYLDDGDLLLSWSGTPGTSFGAFIWLRGRAVLNQHIFRCEPRASSFTVEFLRLAVNSRLGEMIARAHGGVGLRHVTRGQLDGLYLPLPPLAEQHRIVAKVDALMGLLDRLEAARDARDGTRAALRDSALSTLAEADEPEAVQASWTRIAEHMDDLFTDPADVAPLRQTILQLAVRGRLVPQDASDEPARVLLTRIAAEKARLIESGEIDKTRKPKVDPIEEDPAVPGTWMTPRLTDIAYVVDPNPSHRNPEYVQEGFPFISTQEFKGREGLILDTPRRVSESTMLEQEQRCKFSGRSIAFSRKGTIGKTRRLPDGVRVALLDSLCVVNPMSDVDAAYLNLALRSPPVHAQVALMTRGLALRQISVGRVRLLRIPIPPLAEQHRIVAKVGALMGLCDDLEARLTAAKTTRGAFAAAAVHHLDAA